MTVQKECFRALSKKSRKIGYCTGKTLIHLKIVQVAKEFAYVEEIIRDESDTAFQLSSQGEVPGSCSLFAGRL